MTAVLNLYSFWSSCLKMLWIEAGLSNSRTEHELNKVKEAISLDKQLYLIIFCVIVIFSSALIVRASVWHVVKNTADAVISHA